MVAYALIAPDGAVLDSTADFDPASARKVASLQGGTVLMTSGDSAEAEIARLRAELDEAASANMAKEIFLSNMSHDIRTPMNAIVGMTALAKKHIDEKPRVMDALDKIETASTHLLGLINDVLDMSRINSGRMKLAEERFSLSDLLHDLTIITRPLMETRGHTWSLTAEDIEAESFWGDPLRLRQIFVNIISNAAKYTPDHGQIQISFREEADGDRCQLIFRCQDNGIGMSEEFLARVYEPFERVQNSTLSRVEGTGLGMSIVSRLVKSMDGAIQLDSHLGEGTCVTIRIPLRTAEEEPASAALSDVRLLIIEHDPDMREKYAQYLTDAQVRFDLAHSASEALSALTEADLTGDPYQLVLIGQEEEHQTSPFDVAGYLHKSRPQLPLVLASTADWEKIEYQAERSGIHTFIPLPFFRKSLLAGLSRALQDNGGEGAASEYPNLSGKRILLVEDNPINREIAQEILGMTGAEIVSVENGQQAVDSYCANPPGHYQLILMDVQMPVMNGYDATRAIRASGRQDADLPIYAMTANTFAEDIAKAREAGMNGHIAKPIDINALMQMLRRL